MYAYSKYEGCKIYLTHSLLELEDAYRSGANMIGVLRDPRKAPARSGVCYDRVLAKAGLNPYREFTYTGAIS